MEIYHYWFFFLNFLKKYFYIDIGFPTPSVHWYQGTMKLVSNNNIRISQTGGRHQLSFIRYELVTPLPNLRVGIFKTKSPFLSLATKKMKISKDNTDQLSPLPVSEQIRELLVSSWPIRAGGSTYISAIPFMIRKLNNCQSEKKKLLEKLVSFVPVNYGSFSAYHCGNEKLK